MIQTVINSIISQGITTGEQTLSQFTCCEQKPYLDTWKYWEGGKQKQLRHFYDLQIFFKVNPLSKWTEYCHHLFPLAILCQEKWSTCDQNYCDGSKCAAPLLHTNPKNYSSYVEYPVQCFFRSLVALQNFRIFGGDAKEAFDNYPFPDIPTFMIIDNQCYYKWYLYWSKIKLDKSWALPVPHILQVVIQSQVNDWNSILILFSALLS